MALREQQKGGTLRAAVSDGPVVKANENTLREKTLSAQRKPSHRQPAVKQEQNQSEMKSQSEVKQQRKHDEAIRERQLQGTIARW